MIKKILPYASSLLIALPILSAFAPSSQGNELLSKDIQTAQARSKSLRKNQQIHTDGAYSGRIPRSVWMAPGGAEAGRLAGSASDYLADIAQQGVFRWPESMMPLRVYIEPGHNVPGYKAHYPDVLRAAWDAWVIAAGNKVSWTEVKSQDEANVICKFNNETPEHSNGTEAGRTKTYTRFNTATNEGVIYKATVGLATRLPDRALSEEEIKKTFLHEVGHAFGLAGHSPTSTDIMHAQVSPRMMPFITKRDQATLNRLYQGYGNVARAN